MSFLDPLLESLRRPRANPKQSLGVGGTAIYGGWISSQETSPALAGRERYRTYSELVTNVSIVAASCRYFLNLAAKASWKVEPAEDSGADGERACEIVQDSIDGTDTPWSRIIRRAAMYIFHGFSIGEWVARLDEEGRVLLRDIETRPQITIERWDADENGRLMGVIQRAPRDQREIYLPRPKLLYCLDDALNDSPEGLGLFRHLAEPARRLNRYLQLEGCGFEGDLAGMPIARMPLTTIRTLVAQAKLKKEDADALELPFRDFIQNHVKSPSRGLIIDSQPYTDSGPSLTPSATPQWNLEVAKSEAGSLTEVAAAIERTNREMARVIGTEHLLMGGDGSGSLAMSRDKSNNFALQVDSCLTTLRDTMRSDIAKPLMRLNGLPEELAPTLKTDSIAYRDIEQVTSALAQLAQAGAPILGPDDPAIREIRDQLGLTMPEVIHVQGDAAGLTDKLTPEQRALLGLPPKVEEPAQGAEGEELPPEEGEEAP